MIEENQDLNLETDHLEEVIESPPPAQPVVVIQYRTRGVPWYLVLPLLVLVPLGAVAVYHRVSSRVRYPLVPPPSADQSTRKAAERQAVPARSPKRRSARLFRGCPLPRLLILALPWRSIRSRSPPDRCLPSCPPSPAAKADLTKPASPAAATPAATKEGEPSKSAGSSDLAKAAPGVTVASTPPPAATLVKEPGPQAAATTPVDATRPAPRGPVAIGFSVPAADDSPFAEFDISRGLPAGSTTDQEKTAASNGPAAASDPSPDRQPQPTQEQLLQDIQAEAAEKNAELKQRRDLKDRAREVVDAESQARVEDERAAFRRDLREAIKLSRKEAATQIDDLCNRYGRNYSDELRSKARYSPGAIRRQDVPRGQSSHASLSRSSRSWYSRLPRQRNSPHDQFPQRSQRLERGSHRCGQAITEHQAGQGCRRRFQGTSSPAGPSSRIRGLEFRAWK